VRAKVAGYAASVLFLIEHRVLENPETSGTLDVVAMKCHLVLPVTDDPLTYLAEIRIKGFFYLLGAITVPPIK
jgi:hypothetical protein